MRDWKQKDKSGQARPTESFEPEPPTAADPGFWDQYGFPVLVVLLVIVTAGLCNAFARL